MKQFATGPKQLNVQRLSLLLHGNPFAPDRPQGSRGQILLSPGLRPLCHPYFCRKKNATRIMWWQPHVTHAMILKFVVIDKRASLDSAHEHKRKLNTFDGYGGCCLPVAGRKLNVQFNGPKIIGTNSIVRFQQGTPHQAHRLFWKQRTQKELGLVARASG